MSAYCNVCSLAHLYHQCSVFLKTSPSCVLCSTAVWYGVSERQHLFFRGIYGRTTHCEPPLFSILSQPCSGRAAAESAAGHFVQRGPLSFGFTSSLCVSCCCCCCLIYYPPVSEEEEEEEEELVLTMAREEELIPC